MITSARNSWENKENLALGKISPIFPFLYHGGLQLIELAESLHARLVVDDAARFSATVHGEDSISHIYSSQRNGRGEDVAKGASACHITMVDETLAWHTCFLANACEDGGRNGIARILLCGIELDDRTTSQHRMIGWVVFL